MSEEMMRAEDAARRLLRELNAPASALSIAVIAIGPTPKLVVRVSPLFKLSMVIPTSYLGFAVELESRDPAQALFRASAALAEAHVEFMDMSVTPKRFVARDNLDQILSSIDSISHADFSPEILAAAKKALQSIANISDPTEVPETLVRDLIKFRD